MRHPTSGRYRMPYYDILKSIGVDKRSGQSYVECYAPISVVSKSYDWLLPIGILSCTSRSAALMVHHKTKHGQGVSALHISHSHLFIPLVPKLSEPGDWHFLPTLILSITPILAYCSVYSSFFFVSACASCLLSPLAFDQHQALVKMLLYLRVSCPWIESKI